MTGGDASRERLLDLLALRATERLSQDDAAELNRLLGEHEGVDSRELELAAAAAELAFLQCAAQAMEPMPETLRARIVADAGTYAAAPRASVDREPAPLPVRDHRRTSSLVGWVAAAAMLVVALLSWWPQRALTPAEARLALVDSGPADLIQVPWTPPDAEGFEGVTGDVVWSTSAQQGYLRLANMPANDPARAQFQLWIVDPERDSRPVDGGVFDIPAGEDEVIVPIRAALEILDPTVFAITEEQPGGVVVSDGPLLVVAGGAD